MLEGSLIRESARSDFEDLKEIALEKLGKDFATEQQFYERGCVSLVVEFEEKVVAYGTAAIINDKTHPELADFMSIKTGMLCSVAVANGYEGLGIASRLASERIQKLKDLGCDTILVTAWRSESHGVHVQGILERFGFEVVDELIGYWAGCSCSYCGDHACSCDAVVFKLDCKKEENV